MKKRLLITRFSALGDVAMLAVILPEFIEQNPEVEVLMVSRPGMKFLFQKHPNLTFIGADVDNQYNSIWGLRRLAQGLKKHKPTHFADCHNVIRTQILQRLMRIPNYAELQKGRAEKKKMTRKQNKQIIPLENMHERYADVFRKLGFSLELSHQLKNHHKEKTGIGMAPFAFYKEKMFSIEESKALALKLAESGKEVLLFGGGELEAQILTEWENLHPNITSLAGKFDLKEELHVMERLELMISMDSANMHLASLAGTRVISIWGSTHPYLGFLGYGQKLKDCVQNESLFCRPCSVFGNKPCYRKNWECLNSIEVDSIYSKVLE